MKGLIKSFGYAFRGIGYQLSCERNFRIHCFAALTVLLLSAFYDLSVAERCLLILQIALVLFAESINTAIEKCCDAVTKEQSEPIRRAKDVAAGAVLIFALGSLFLAYYLFWDPAVFAAIFAFFSVWYRALLLALYVAAMLILIFCKKTYKGK